VEGRFHRLLALDRLELVWAGFALANLAAMEVLIHLGTRDWQTVPFHFIYVSFTLLYGLRAWQSGRTIVGLLFVTVTTGAVTTQAILRGAEDLPELTEVPLMTLMFAGMAYHVYRRQQATAVAEHLALERQQLLDREHAFISDASHELLTPLTIARGHLELIDRQPDPNPESVHETCDIALAELKRMERLVDRLLLVESAQSVEFLRVAPVEAEEFVNTVFRRWRAAADRRWVLDGVVAGTVPIDRDQLSLALDAILENAVTHTDIGDTIAFGAAEQDGQLVLHVRDTGNGIDPAALPHIFDRFFRGDRGRSRRSGGAGLGLAVARAVVKAHGGEISAASVPGSGAAFQVTLPGLRRDGEPVAGATYRFDGDRRAELPPETAHADVHNV
jgi:signal transduction histidine kinase